jgi:hypothetical protein
MMNRYLQYQRRDTRPHTWFNQCVQSVERALGTLGAHAAVGGASPVSLHEHPNEELLLGRRR